jgi:hypothetical protein
MIHSVWNKLMLALVKKVGRYGTYRECQPLTIDCVRLLQYMFDG